MSNLRKIQNPIQFKPLLRFQPKQKKPNYPNSIYNYAELFGSKFEFRETLSVIALFEKNSKFHKI